MTRILVQRNLKCSSLVKNVKYHNSKPHINVCSLQRKNGTVTVNISKLKRGKYGLRVEGITDPKDDGSRFDIDVRIFSTPKLTTGPR